MCCDDESVSSAPPLPPEREPQHGAGQPDAFMRLWMPHRMAYIKGESKEGCAFCEIPAGPDDAGLVVARGGAGFARIDPHPYNRSQLVIGTPLDGVDYNHLHHGDTDTPAED